jgi:tetratricopeptide (TPR) repeat protein
MLALALAAAPAASQRPPPSTIQLLRSAAGSGIEANRLENAGRFADALDGYTATINFTDRALDDFGSYGIPFQARPSIAYWLAARSHFDAARMQLELRRSRTEVDHHLTRARQAMDAVLILDSIQARRAGQQATADTWKYGFLRGQIQLLRGDLPGARRDYQQVTRLNPGFPPAREALSFIAYAQGGGVRGTTGEGHELPPKPAPVLSLAQLVDLGFDFLGLIYKEHSAEIAFAQRLTQIAVQ